MPALRHIPALAAAALALLAAGCGEDDKGKLTAAQADPLVTKLDDLQKAIDNGSCEYAQKVVEEGTADAEELTGVSGRLKRNILDGFERLEARLDGDCEKEEPEETPTPEATETPTEVPTEAPTEPPATPTPTPEVTEEPTEVPTEVPTEEPTAAFPTPQTGGASPEEEG